ncbi:MAG: threonine synthase, partial [Clostridiales bacterium]|nr:threonine synthase [Clostridiales bacterium]
MTIMLYNSTRNSKLAVESAQAIVQGISDDGGLFVPKKFPKLNKDDLVKLIDMSYAKRAKFIFSLFLTDFSEADLDYCVNGAYNTTNFTSDNIAEIAKLNDQFSMLELWHGPTCAFKDMALQVLPYLLTVSSKKVVKDKEIVILVATSGDTGKAALEGFKDVD